LNGEVGRRDALLVEDTLHHRMGQSRRHPFIGELSAKEKGAAGGEPEAGADVGPGELLVVQVTPVFQPSKASVHIPGRKPLLGEAASELLDASCPDSQEPEGGIQDVVGRRGRVPSEGRIPGPVPVSPHDR
jgi:hypothetical protein